LVWQLGSVHAEAGQRDRGVASAQEAVALFKQMANPQADWLESQLQKYQAGQIAVPFAGVGFSEPASAATFGGQLVASGWTDPGIVPGQAAGSSGPGLLRMAFAAMKSMARFAGAGFKPTAAGIYKKLLQICG